MIPRGQDSRLLPRWIHRLRDVLRLIVKRSVSTYSYSKYCCNRLSLESEYCSPLLCLWSPLGNNRKANITIKTFSVSLRLYSKIYIYPPKPLLNPFNMHFSLFSWWLYRLILVVLYNRLANPPLQLLNISQIFWVRKDLSARGFARWKASKHFLFKPAIISFDFNLFFHVSVYFKSLKKYLMFPHFHCIV